MTDPIFILGCHRSGTSVVAGLLNEACGVAMGELMPATADNPLGYFEPQGVVDAHRDLLFQLERDWTCPPTDFKPGELDLSRLEEQVAAHQALPAPWAMKDPRSMFLLRAWARLGVDRARLVAVVRAPADTVRSIERRDGIREDRADAIVDAHLVRLGDIAARGDVAVIRFSSDAEDVLSQARDLAASLELDWDAEAASSFFDTDLVRHREPLVETTPALDRLVANAFPYTEKPLPATDLTTLRPRHEPRWPLDQHLAVRYAQQRHELWELAQFETTPNPQVAELILEGGRLGGGHRPGVGELHQIEVSSPVSAGALIMRERLRPDGVIAHGLLSDRSQSEVEFFFRSMYVNTNVFAELVVDVPAPRGSGLLGATPEPHRNPRPAVVLEGAERSGWDHVTTQRVSPGRVGLVFRKRISTDSDLVPLVTDLMMSLDRVRVLDKEVGLALDRLGSATPKRAKLAATGDVGALGRRAEQAERDLRRLRSRRSVRLALAASQPFAQVFKAVRTWKKNR